MQAGLQSADVTFMLGITHVQLGNDRLALPFYKEQQNYENDVEALFQCGLCFATRTYSRGETLF